MSEENGRRESDTKLAFIEQHLEFIAQEMKEENANGQQTYHAEFSFLWCADIRCCMGGRLTEAMWARPY